MIGEPLIVGVDPGATGALAAIGLDGTLVDICDMPAHDGTVNGALIADWLDGRHIIEAWVEHVHAMPKQGVSSSFKFGCAYGVVLGCLAGARVPIRHITPAKWKREMRLTADKGQARRRAVELWPTWSDSFKRVKDDGRAEAALLARYGLTVTEVTR